MFPLPMAAAPPPLCESCPTQEAGKVRVAPAHRVAAHAVEEAVVASHAPRLRTFIIAMSPARHTRATLAPHEKQKRASLESGVGHLWQVTLLSVGARKHPHVVQAPKGSLPAKNNHAVQRPVVHGGVEPSGRGCASNW